LIALDTSSFIAYLSGADGPDVDATDVALQHRQAALPPVVLSELLSDPDVEREVKDLFTRLPLLEVLDGYWHRAGLLRARLLGQGRKARLADTLIAQSCLDHDVELVTRDRDFQPIARMAGLRLLIPVPRNRSDR
jgi:predicted nucleic acid-binding protein